MVIPILQGLQIQRWQKTNLNLSKEPGKHRHLWLKATPNFQPEYLALVKEENTIPLHWPIAVITNIHPHQMASSVWLHLGKSISTPSFLQKFNPQRMRIVKYSVTVVGVSVC